jgi:hypothetical protein
MADHDKWVRDRHAFRGDEPSGLGPLGRQFTQLTERLLAASSVHQALEQVVAATLRIVPGADLVSITLRSTDGALHTPVETAPLATELDLLQYETRPSV